MILLKRKNIKGVAFGLAAAMCLSVLPSSGVVAAETQEDTVAKSLAQVISQNPYGDMFVEESIDIVDGGDVTTITNNAIKDTLVSDVKGRNNGNLVVVLDPGHDLKHPGAIYNGAEESTLNLKIATACYNVLATQPGLEVYMTRAADGSCAYPASGDTDSLELAKRVEFAKSKNADMYVSIHLNAANAKAMGSEVYYQNENLFVDLSNKSNRLANNILAQLSAIGLNNRGAKIRNATSTTYDDGTISDYYSVIRRGKMNGIASVIVEHCFMDTPEEFANYLSDDDKLARLGMADAQGILNTTSVFNRSLEDYYESVFDASYYWGLYPDVQRRINRDDTFALLYDYLTEGIFAGKSGRNDFNIKYLYLNYPLLRNSLGVSKPKLISYYITNGKASGLVAGHYLNDKVNENDFFDERKQSVPIEVTPPNNALYKGEDYSDVYDYSYYIGKYADLKEAFGSDKDKAIEHFVLCGMKEGRIGNTKFDVKSYYKANPDLRGAFGKNWEALYQHYRKYGKNEKRQFANVDAIAGATTVYNGVDYSQVYNFAYYISTYPDMKAAFDLDDAAAIKHFVTNGMKERRIASDNFNVRSYFKANADLRAAFGKNWVAYYDHYMKNGYKEKRTTTGVDTIQGAVSSYKGKDYSAVYNFEYYLKKYPGLVPFYEYDDAGAMEHFVVFGMNEGRQASEDFNLNTYKANYSDLVLAFGGDNKKYYEHFIENGKKEGRVANATPKPQTQSQTQTPTTNTVVYDESQFYVIMGASNVTAGQLERYFQTAGGSYSYPDEYEDSDAPILRDFCEIYVQECQIEGVKPEVAFCQAMMETRFLQYGGDVSVEQYNFCGLGATGGVPGDAFDSVRMGIRAHVQHLKAYASTQPLNQACVDPRYNFVYKGNSKFVEYLGRQENPQGYGWAASARYGFSLRTQVDRLLAL